MSVQPWKRVDPTIFTKVDYREIIIKTFEVPGKDEKKTIATYLLENVRSAGVVALTNDRQVIISRQFRHGPERIMDEIPGGGVEEGEDPEAAAQRELAEETGYAVGSIELLGVTPRDAYMNGLWFYYLATDCELMHDKPNADENEQIETVLVSIDEFLASAKSGNMTDPAAVLMAYDKLKELASV